MSIKKLFFLMLFCFFSLGTARNVTNPVFTIMLDPAGDARQPGRLIEDSLERGITLQYAQALKETLERITSCSVIITRSTGEIVYPLQNANFANRIVVHLYVSIHACYQKQTKPRIDLYYLQNQEFFAQLPSSFSMIPIDKAYQYHFDVTKKYIQTSIRTVQEYYPQIPIQSYGIPFAPLLGIHAPAIGIECILSKKDDWRVLVEPIAISIARIVEQK